ncbi:Uncharacterized protein Adt_14304 [Abeliophyllum distichum]|uniref:Uncharacterized protein n=1 Tax=Abeliophyllum distichum TaxID=126358 RepID=A0ABD1TZ98_9LAMI
MRQGASEPLQSHLNYLNEEMLFCERISNTESLSALKRGLNMNLLFWRDVRNKNPTTFDHLVEMIMEEITNEYMIYHRNRGRVVPSPVQGTGYGRGKRRSLYHQQPRRRNYPTDSTS